MLKWLCLFLLECVLFKIFFFLYNGNLLMSCCTTFLSPLAGCLLAARAVQTPHMQAAKSSPAPPRGWLAPGPFGNDLWGFYQECWLSAFSFPLLAVLCQSVQGIFTFKFAIN